MESGRWVRVCLPPKDEEITPHCSPAFALPLSLRSGNGRLTVLVILVFRFIPTKNMSDRERRRQEMRRQARPGRRRFGNRHVGVGTLIPHPQASQPSSKETNSHGPKRGLNGHMA